MVSEKSLVYDIRLSSIGPSQVTGDVIHEPSNMDLAMKLHYLKCVYIYNSEAAKEVSIVKIKGVMFLWLNYHYVSCGRFRRSESGRPYVKCNDCGIRFIEAKSDKSVDEWLEITAKDDSVQNLLVYHAPIGPEIAFSPLIYMQVTYFKCGGLALGLNWAHVLGDAFSVSDWINSVGPRMAGTKPKVEPTFTKPEKPKSPTPITKDPITAKRVDPVGDNWVLPKNSNLKMETFSFHITQTQLSNLQLTLGKKKAPGFETLCAVIWKSVARVRDRAEPKIVTVIKKDPTRIKGQLGNYQVISSVQTNISTSNVNLSDLTKLLLDEAIDDGSKIEAAIEKDGGVSDFVVYGANLTFVDLGEADFYELEMDEHKPELVHYSIENVGEEGVVMVLPGKKSSGEKDSGRLVTVTLPENEVIKVKNEMRKNGVLLEKDVE